MTESSPEPSQPARMPGTEAHEIGDFCVYESLAPASIPAKRSAAILVIQNTSDETRPVLHYRRANHPERPYRSIEFVNTTGHSLSRGVCTVFVEGTYGGSCVIPAVKPGEHALLNHALDQGMRIYRQVKRTQHQVSSIVIAKGVCEQRRTSRRMVLYEIEISIELTLFYISITIGYSTTRMRSRRPLMALSWSDTAR